jgi:hypothetical protein
MPPRGFPKPSVILFPVLSSYNRDMRHLLLVFLLCLPGLRAGAQAFDLFGPKVDVHVKRGQVTLPIGEVPNLLPGDRLWIHPDFPDDQSARYVLIVAFLRGITNPPPNEWFTRVETWNREAREEGVFVNVPEEAQQAILFLAPETGGDFSTLRNAVRGRPGIFVRASQDLQAASWDRMRLDAFLAEVRVTSQTDPKSLKERAETAGRSLGIKVNQECFDKPTDQQASCLQAHTEGLVMDDSNAQTRVSQLTTGSTADLMNQLSYSTMAGGGAYSPYIGAIVDTARILSSLHTAHFQYIPALALPAEDTLNLRLNVPPSFRDPKSVVVVALPPIGPPKMPPLHPVDPKETFCAQKPDLVLPAEGAPLALATQLAHDLTLHIETSKGAVDLPVKADPGEGGLAVYKPVPLLAFDEVTGVIRGKWGFDDWQGPSYHLRISQPDKWSLAPSDQLALVVGREDTVHFRGGSTLCVDKVVESASTGSPVTLSWKSPQPDALVTTIPMADAAPGPIKVEIRQFGLEKPDSLALNAYAEAASLDRMTLSAGDPDAVLTGTRLDEVAKASLNGVTWAPGTLSRVQDVDHLAMRTAGSTTTFQAGEAYSAKVELRDGRELKVHVTVDPPRPQIALLSKDTQDAGTAPATPVHFGNPDDLPVEKRLVFFLKSKVPSSFPRDEKIEVAAVDGSFHTALSLADGSLMLEDANTALGVVEPLVRFGPSAFGPVEARPVSSAGVAGDWLPLGTLVRMPGFKELHCPRALAKPCALSGSNLFLATAVSATPEFSDPTDVPPDFTGTQLTVPHPSGGMLYVKLRDDPATVQTLTLPVLPMTSMTMPLPKLPQPQPAPEPPTVPQEQPKPEAPNATPQTRAQPGTATSGQHF